MTVITILCPWCEHHIELTPADVIVTARNRRSYRGVYRWFHCGQPIIRQANERVFGVLVAAGCDIEYANPSPHFQPPLDESEVEAFGVWLDEVSTPADMGLVRNEGAT